MRFGVAAACLALSACGEKSDPPPSLPDAPASATCADDGVRLPGLGICSSEAAKYFADLAPLQAPQGCSWTFNEALLGDTGEGVLYRALACNGVVTQLEFSAGAHSASLDLVASPVVGPAALGATLVRLFTINAADPQGGLRALVVEGVDDPEEAAACEVRPASFQDWPADALVVDVNAAYKAAHAITDAEPRSACGPLGLDTDSVNFWRIAQGFAWRFDLGQDEVGVDPNGFLLMRRAADGSWSPAS